MSAVPSEFIPWSAKRWALTVLFAVVGQLALILWLSDYRVVVPPRPGFSTHVRVVNRPSVDGPDGLLLSANEPTLFALVNPYGFSQSAWLFLPQFAYSITNSPAPPRWLDLPEERLVEDFDRFLQTNLLAERTFSTAIPPVLTQVQLPRPVIVAETGVRIEGGLAGRTLLEGQKLPTQPEPILTNSVLRLVVDASGRTLSAALVGSSGVGAADFAALRFARRARFSPWPVPSADAAETRSPETELTAGELVIQWHRVQWQPPGPGAPPTLTHP